MFLIGSCFFCLNSNDFTRYTHNFIYFLSNTAVRYCILCRYEPAWNECRDNIEET